MRRPLLRGTAIACLVGSLAACSSSSHTASTTSAPAPTSSTSTSTTSTTAPTAATVAAVRSFFAHDGKTLLAFERATAVVATGAAPRPADCLRLARQVLPKIVPDSNSLFPLAKRIPDPTLADVFGQEVKLRVLVVLGCAQGAARAIPPITGPSAEQGYATIRASAEGLKRLLARYGIAL